jgi:predicted RNase H-like HicB family nuclease
MLVKFEVYYDGEYWCARGIGTDIFTQGKSLDDLMENIKESVSIHFEDQLQSGEDIRVLSISEFEVHPVAKASGS